MLLLLLPAHGLSRIPDKHQKKTDKSCSKSDT